MSATASFSLFRFAAIASDSSICRHDLARTVEGIDNTKEVREASLPDACEGIACRSVRVAGSLGDQCALFSGARERGGVLCVLRRLTLPPLVNLAFLFSAEYENRFCESPWDVGGFDGRI